MRIQLTGTCLTSFLLLFLFLAAPAVCAAESDHSTGELSTGELSTGGITFTGEREGVCVLIEGEYLEESIYFKLDTCDRNHEVKEQFRDRTPFTLLVPKGEHRLLLMKEGEKVISDRIRITPGEILEYKLP